MRIERSNDFGRFGRDWHFVLDDHYGAELP
jgi:hypothetical protein